MFLVSATKLSPVCRSSVAGHKGIQVDRDINEMNSNYVTDIQATSIQNEQLVSGDVYPYIHHARPEYCHVSGRHDMCPGVNTA